jgi:AcrR family transcriptional regulator
MDVKGALSDPASRAANESGLGTKRRRARRDAILAAAIEEFRSAGLINARLDNVATRASVAKGTLYSYFRSKEDLFKAAVRSLIQPLLLGLEQRVATVPGSSEELLRQAIRQISSDVALTQSGRELFRTLVVEGRRMPDISEFYRDEVMLRGLAVIRMIIWRGIARGEFRRSAVVDFPELIFAPCEFMATWQLVFGDTHAIDAEKFVDAHIEFVLAALRPR